MSLDFVSSRLLRCLDFSKVDEWTLLSGSEDQTVMVWDIKEEIAAKKLSQKRPEFDAVFVESPGRRDSGHFLSMCSTDVSTIQVALCKLNWAGKCSRVIYNTLHSCLN